MSRRRWGVLAGVALLAVAVAVAAAGWHFSSAVLVPDHSAWPAETTVEALPPGRVVLERSEDSRAPRDLRARVAGRAGDRRRGPERGRGDGDPAAARGRRLPGAGDAGRPRPQRLRRRPDRGARPAVLHRPDPRRARADAGLARPRPLPHLGDRRPRHQQHPADRPAGGARPPSRRLADAADHLPRGPRRPAQPGWLPPHGLDRVARPRRRRPLRARARGRAPAPGRLLDGRRDRRPVHAALAPGAASGGPRARRPSPRLEGDPLLQRHRAGLPRVRAPSRSRGRSAPASTPTGTASTRSGTPRTSSCRSCSSTAPTTTWCRSRPATTSPPSCRAGSPTSACPRRATPRSGTSTRRSTNAGSAAFSIGWFLNHAMRG